MEYRDGVGIAVKMYRLERWCYDHKLYVCAKLIYRFMQIFLGCTIPYSVEMGGGVTIAHFHGIVIHHLCKIGAGTVIYQNVTLGGRNGKPGPEIGENCVIGAGACILGKIKIGNNVNVGANAVVLESVPDNCTVVGVPARIIKRKDNL